MSKNARHDDRQLRAIGHKLKPVVTVAGKGLSEAVMEEVDRALRDHELIKIKLAVSDRETRSQLAGELCQRSGADLVQGIGNVILVLRRSSNPDPRLSNLSRPL
jgi:RNA-binding protein